VQFGLAERDPSTVDWAAWAWGAVFVAIVLNLLVGT
jgi:hypothetical protein